MKKRPIQLAYEASLWLLRTKQETKSENRLRRQNLEYSPNTIKSLTPSHVALSTKSVLQVSC